jgi:hypothetical protein
MIISFGDNKVTVYKIDISEGDWDYLVETFNKFIVCQCNEIYFK